MIRCQACEQLNVTPVEYDKLCRTTPRLLIKTTNGGFSAFTEYRLTFLRHAIKVLDRQGNNHFFHASVVKDIREINETHEKFMANFSELKS